MKNWIIGFVLGVVILGLIGWRVIDKQKQDAQLESSQKARNGAAPSVDMAVAGPMQMDDVIETIGSAETPFNVKLAPKLTGLVTAVNARLGDSVKQGQALVVLDPTETQGQVLQARQALAEAKYRLAQAILTTKPTNVAVTSGIRQQRAAYNSARADQNQVATNYKATVAGAKAAVTDAEAKVAAAKSQVDVASQNLVTAQANSRNAKSKYDRENGLYKQSYVAAQDLDDAKTAWDVAIAAENASRAQVRSAQSALDSANAQLNSAKENLNIALAKGISDIADAKAHTEQANALLELANSNRAQTPAYLANIEALRATVGAAEGTLRQAEARLNDTTLRSPIDGTVTDRSADPGSAVNAGTSVLTVQFLDWLFVTGGIPIEQAPKVHTGQEVDVVFDSFPSQVFTGTLAQVTQSADPTSRQFTVQVRLENKDHLIRPGMFGHISVILKRYKAPVAVPREAVLIDKTGKATVTLVDENLIAHVTPVKIGRQSSKYIEITEGLTAGQRVVTLSYQPVKDGKKVKDNKAKAQTGEKKA